MLGSYWALVPAVFGAALLVVRTLFEDRNLAERLDGYVEYTTRTRNKLVPGIF